MGLYIKGAKMPKCCERCPCAYFTEGVYADVCQVMDDGKFTYTIEEYVSYGEHKGERPDWCPLVELPSKHGRLVDCDALMEKESTQYENVMKDGQRDWFDKIIADLIHKTLEVTLTEKNAPTVLEAEGVEDND